MHKRKDGKGYQARFRNISSATKADFKKPSITNSKYNNFKEMLGKNKCIRTRISYQKWLPTNNKTKIKFFKNTTKPKIILQLLRSNREIHYHFFRIQIPKIKEPILFSLDPKIIYEPEASLAMIPKDNYRSATKQE